MAVKVAPAFGWTEVVDAVDYVFSKASAQGQSVVVNLSAGYIAGPHDGTSLLETMIDGLTGPGRVFVTVAHNWRDRPWHAEAMVTSSQDSITIQISGSGRMTPVTPDGSLGPPPQRRRQDDRRAMALDMYGRLPTRSGRPRRRSGAAMSSQHAADQLAALVVLSRGPIRLTLPHEQ
jgi:hypothetical protein